MAAPPPPPPPHHRQTPRVPRSSRLQNHAQQAGRSEDRTPDTRCAAGEATSLHGTNPCPVPCPQPHSQVRRRTRKHGGQPQSVLMRPDPQLSVKTCAGGGGGAVRDPLPPHAYLKGRGCLGAWGYRGMYVIIAISRFCQEESLKGLKDQRHSTPFNSAWDKKFGAVGATAPAPLCLKTRGGGGG